MNHHHSTTKNHQFQHNTSSSNGCTTNCKLKKSCEQKEKTWLSPTTVAFTKKSLVSLFVDCLFSKKVSKSLKIQTKMILSKITSGLIEQTKLDWINVIQLAYVSIIFESKKKFTLDEDKLLLYQSTCGNLILKWNTLIRMFYSNHER